MLIFGIIEKDNFIEVEEKEYKKIKDTKREIYIPLWFTKDNEKIEVFCKDIDYWKSEKLLRTMLESDSWINFKFLIIWIACFIIWILLWIFGTLLLSWNNSNQVVPLMDEQPTSSVVQNNNLVNKINESEDKTKTLENKKIELEDKLIQCEIENIKLQTKIEYIPSQNTKECPVCEDASIITRELEQCKKDYNNFFTEERKFLDYIGNEIYQNCKINESEECKNLYFNFRKSGL